ncbi:MAG: acyl-CoA synthetase (NDP forming) [Paracoccaceae bacterium]|jgi:acyl-CoA synthetase (NDP forming)
MKRDLSRLLNPKSIAVIGGGAWCASIINAARRIGFQGDIFPVHPSGKDIAGKTALKRLEDWPGAIDAAFIGINRHATIDAVKALRALGAGGAVCFASGFTEAAAEDHEGIDLQARLVRAAGDMPILGPNCYGFVNALDGAAIWPDQHGLEPVSSGVAILTQSSNIAINLTMQRRALPIAFMVTCGNMAQTSQAQIAYALLDDPRVTAIGLHVEGFADLREWEALARKAADNNVPLVALKVGVSDQARQATVSHTASMAGGDAGAQAFLQRLGIPRVRTLPGLLETLKLLHCTGPLASNRIASISCSGGEASLIADLAVGRDLVFPTLSDRQAEDLRGALGPMVALANPLDYNTYIWRDVAAMTRAWAGLTGDGISMTLSIVDYPHTDAADWVYATESALAVQAQTGAPFALVASLPELMPEDTARQLMAGRVVPFFGLSEALDAVEAAAGVGTPEPKPVLLPGLAEPDVILTEAEAKAALAGFGVPVPRFCQADNPAEAGRCAAGLRAPLALKGVGLAHKSEHGAVRLGLAAADVAQAAAEIGTDRFLVEEMAMGGVAELLIGVTRDPAHGFVLTLGAGGVLTEILADTVSLLVPSGSEQVKQALKRLKCAPLLAGYRGKPAADISAVLAVIGAVQDYVIANADTVSEVEINPLICTPEGAIAVDALIRKATT